MAATDSLEGVLDYLESNQTDDAQIYAHLTALNPRRVRSLIKALRNVEDAEFSSPNARRGNKKKFQGDKSTLKGKLFERLASETVGGIKCFKIAKNVQTTTNEIDLLVTLGPSARFVPALRLWGTHFVCECKFHKTSVSTTWLGKLNTVMELHGAQIGLLISKKGVAKSSAGTRTRTQLQMMAIKTPPTFILPVDFDDLASCAAGKNLLQLISARFVETRAGIAKAAALLA